jgi:excisionase family DNA binding protein
MSPLNGDESREFLDGLEDSRDGMTRGGAPTELLDIREAAAFLGVSQSTVRRLIQAKQLPHVRIGGKDPTRATFPRRGREGGLVRIQVSDLRAYIARNRHP